MTILEQNIPDSYYSYCICGVRRSCTYGGIQRISNVSQIVVPFMAVFYILAAMVLIIANIEKLPGALAYILQDAFGMKAVSGGDGVNRHSDAEGVARGIFSNEAGLGSAPRSSCGKDKRTCTSGTCYNDRNLY